MKLVKVLVLYATSPRFSKTVVRCWFFFLLVLRSLFMAAQRDEGEMKAFFFFPEERGLLSVTALFFNRMYLFYQILYD